MLITFTILLTTKVKWIKLRPAFSIAGSWIRRQVQQMRCKAQWSVFVHGHIRVCMCSCDYVNFFPKRTSCKWQRWTGARWRQPLGGFCANLPYPLRHDPESRRLSRAPPTFTPPRHTAHTHPSFQAALNEFIQNDLQCMAHLLSTACDHLSSWNVLDTLKGH